MNTSTFVAMAMCFCCAVHARYINSQVGAMTSPYMQRRGAPLYQYRPRPGGRDNSLALQINRHPPTFTRTRQDNGHLQGLRNAVFSQTAPDLDYGRNSETVMMTGDTIGGRVPVYESKRVSKPYYDSNYGRRQGDVLGPASFPINMRINDAKLPRTLGISLNLIRNSKPTGTGPVADTEENDANIESVDATQDKPILPRLSVVTKRNNIRIQTGVIPSKSSSAAGSLTIQSKDLQGQGLPLKQTLRAPNTASKGRRRRISITARRRGQRYSSARRQTRYRGRGSRHLVISTRLGRGNQVKFTGSHRDGRTIQIRHTGSAGVGSRLTINTGLRSHRQRGTTTGVSEVGQTAPQPSSIASKTTTKDSTTSNKNSNNVSDAKIQLTSVDLTANKTSVDFTANQSTNVDLSAVSPSNTNDKANLNISLTDGVVMTTEEPDIPDAPDATEESDA